MNVKNFNELKKAFEKKAKVALGTNVKDFVIEQTNERIKHDVYGSYAPIQYERTYGLYDLKNYQSKVTSSENGVQLSVEHFAKTSEGKNLSKLIILGQVGAKAYGGSDVALYNDEWIKRRKFRYAKEDNFSETPYYEPRNFIALTKQVLSFDRNRKKLVDEFKKGMK